MATFPSAVNSRLKDYNSDSYDATSNPYGMADGGHRENFPRATEDVSAMGEYVADAASEVATNVGQVATNLAQSNEARDLARAWASAPEDQVVAGGFGSSFNYSQKAAASAAAAARFDPVVFVRRDGTQFMTGRLRLRASTASASSLVIPVGEAEPGDNTEDGGVWNGGSALRGIFAGVKRTFYDTFNLPTVTDAEADAGTGTVVRVWTVARVWRAARAALPLMSQAIAEAGTDTVARSVSALALRQSAVAADKEVLVASYTSAQLDGLSSIIQDMPAGFIKYRIEFGGIRLRSGTSVMTVRNGPSGGALNEGAGAYVNVTLQRRGANTDAANATENAWVVAAIGTQADQYGEIVIHDQPAQFWVGHAQYAGVDNNGDTIVSMRGSRYALGNNGANRWGRFALIFGAALAANGYVRIYGVRT